MRYRHIHDIFELYRKSLKRHTILHNSSKLDDDLYAISLEKNFIVLWAYWEEFCKEFVISSITSSDSDISGFQRYFHNPDRDSVEAFLKRNRDYISFSNEQNLISWMSALYVDKEPSFSVYYSNKSDFMHLYAIRNHIAHLSKESQERYNGALDYYELGRRKNNYKQPGVLLKSIYQNTRFDTQRHCTFIEYAEILIRTTVKLLIKKVKVDRKTHN